MFAILVIISGMLFSSAYALDRPPDPRQFLAQRGEWVTSEVDNSHICQMAFGLTTPFRRLLDGDEWSWCANWQIPKPAPMEPSSTATLHWIVCDTGRMTPGSVCRIHFENGWRP